MSNANVDLIKSCYAAFAKGDIATILNAARPEVDWVINGRKADFPTLGAWIGTSGVRDFFSSVAEHIDFTSFTPEDFYPCDETLFVTGHYAGKMKKTGRLFASDFVHIFMFRDGKVARFREFNDTGQLAEAYRG